MDYGAKIKAGGILESRDLRLIGVMSVPDRPGVAAAIFEALGRERLNARFIVQDIDLGDESHIQFCVAPEDSQRALDLLRPIASRLGATTVTESRSVAMISVFGPDFRERPGIAGQAFGALARAGINILAVSTSISTISCIINDHECAAATEALQGVFALP